MVHSLTGLWHHVRGPRFHQESDPRKSSGRPRWASIEGSGGRVKQFKGVERCSWEVRLDGNSYPRMRSPSPWGVGPSGAVFIALIWLSPTSTQAVAPSEPNFWTHSLQIHYNGSVGLRSHSPLGPIRKPWPYNWCRLWEELLVRWWVQQFVKTRLSPLGGGYGGHSTVP